MLHRLSTNDTALHVRMKYEDNGVYWTRQWTEMSSTAEHTPSLVLGRIYDEHINAELWKPARHPGNGPTITNNLSPWVLKAAPCTFSIPTRRPPHARVHIDLLWHRIRPYCVEMKVWLQTLPAAICNVSFQHVLNLHGLQVGWGLRFGTATKLSTPTVQPL